MWGIPDRGDGWPDELPGIRADNITEETKRAQAMNCPRCGGITHEEREDGTLSMVCASGHRQYIFLAPDGTIETAAQKMTRMERRFKCATCGRKFRDFKERLRTKGARQCDECAAKEGQLERLVDYRSRSRRGNSVSPWFLTKRGPL
jgi:DNA-directed RNA polymerase subunit RPC12/RpoP